MFGFDTCTQFHKHISCLSFNCSFRNWMYIQKSGKALADFIGCWFVFQVRECELHCRLMLYCMPCEPPYWANWGTTCSTVCWWFNSGDRRRSPIPLFPLCLLIYFTANCSLDLHWWVLSLHLYITHICSHTLYCCTKNITIKVHMTSKHTIHARKTHIIVHTSMDVSRHTCAHSFIKAHL